jgi:putative endonuclease
MTTLLCSVILAQAGIHAEWRNSFAIPHLLRLPEVDDRLMDTQSYVYILANQRYGTLYIGVTSDLIGRVWQHRESVVDGFTKRYEVKNLVWYEIHPDIISAIWREKQLKKWNREWKMRLVNETNPMWRDLYGDICG